MVPRDELEAMLLAALPMLRAYARKLTGSADAAADLVNDTAERVLRSSASFKPGSNFDAWAARILRNRFIDVQRRKKWDGGGIEDLPETLYSRPPSQEDVVMLEDAARALAHLTSDQLVAVQGATVGASYREMADDFDIPIGTVRSRIARGREALKGAVNGEPVSNHIPAEKRERIERRLSEGASIRAVMAETGAAKGTVQRYRDQLADSGVSLPDRSAAMRLHAQRREAPMKETDGIAAIEAVRDRLVAEVAEIQRKIDALDVALRVLKGEDGASQPVPAVPARALITHRPQRPESVEPKQSRESIRARVLEAFRERGRDWTGSGAILAYARVTYQDLLATMRALHAERLIERMGPEKGPQVRWRLARAAALAPADGRPATAEEFIAQRGVTQCPPDPSLAKSGGAVAPSQPHVRVEPTYGGKR